MFFEYKDFQTLKYKYQLFEEVRRFNLEVRHNI